MQQPPDFNGRPTGRVPASVSTPLLDAQVYRPGTLLASSILVLPVVVALVGAAVFLHRNGVVPGWLPYVALLWIPCAPVFWLMMQSVRTSGVGLAAGRPWSKWVEIPWLLIEHVEQVGPFLVVTGGAGKRLVLLPGLLRDGPRLERQILLRLPAHLLSVRLSKKQQQFVPNSLILPDGGLSGSLHAQPNRRLVVWVIIATLAALALALVLLVAAPWPVGGIFAVLAFLTAGVGLVVLAWLQQAVLIDERGLSVVSLLTRRTQSMSWAQVELIEHSPGEYVLRFRGKRRLRCPGPTLLPPADRDLMRAFIDAHCVSSESPVPILERTWLAILL